MRVGDEISGSFEPRSRADKQIFGGIAVLCVAALSTLWLAFGDSCGGNLVCGVVPAYFVVFFMFFLAAIEVTVTAVWYYRKWAGAA